MRFPEELWPDSSECLAVRALVDGFPDAALILSDKLANTLYFSPAAEALFGDRAEAIVNRLTLSLLGFGERDRVPQSLLAALLGESGPWEGIVHLQTAAGPRQAFASISAIRRRDGSLLAGVVRIGKVQGA